MTELTFTYTDTQNYNHSDLCSNDRETLRNLSANIWRITLIVREDLSYVYLLH